MEATLSKSQIDTKTFITCVNTKKKKNNVEPKLQTRCNTQDLQKSWSIWLHSSFYDCPHGIWEVPGKGVKLELRLPAYITATATPGPSSMRKPHCSLGQHWTLIPLSQVRDGTHVRLDTVSRSSQAEPQWEIRVYIFVIEDLCDKMKQDLQQWGHGLYSWMGRLNIESCQIPTEVFFGQHGRTYSQTYKEKIKEPEHQK